MRKSIMTRLSLLTLCFVLAAISIAPVSASGVGGDGLTPDSIVVGKPVTDMDEGSYNGQHWQAKLSGDPTVCWIRLNYATTAAVLRATLEVPYSSSWLGWYDGTDVRVQSAHNANQVSILWQDGNSKIALSCSGTASITNTQVTNMSVGWSFQ